MKTLWLKPVAWPLAVLLSCGSLFAAESGTAAVPEVPPGKRSEVKAAAFGYDVADATKALQTAINSGARRVIVENVGTPWIVDKIRLVSDQEVVFEKGVVVLAKRGAFRGRGDSLFTASLKTNVMLTGHGATLKMWKQDYDSPAYEKSEWRHALSICSCAHVKVQGLTLADSGGDGIYLGVAKRGVSNTEVHLKDLVCVNNYRQGISVISAEDLLMENCVMKDTGGTAPQAGIDFEPNLPGEKLVNCVLRNCVSENNRGDAFEFYLNNLGDTSAPISIRLENCRSVGCRQAVRLSTGNGGNQPAVNGRIEFVDCRFEHSEEAGISIRGKPAAGCQVRFVRCELVNPAAGKPTQAPIALMSAARNTEPLGGLAFEDCRLQDSLARTPISYQDSAGLPVIDVTGTLTVEQAGRRTSYRLDQARIDAWLPHQVFKIIKPFTVAGVRYEPVYPEATPSPNPTHSVRQRGHAEYLLWTTAGQESSFSVRIQPVGKTTPPPVPVQLISPSGKTQTLAKAHLGPAKSYSFVAQETGAYRIVCEPGNATAQVVSTTGRLCLYANDAAFHLLGTTGQFFFWVSANTNEFGIKIMGGGGIERVNATLLDSSGKTVAVKQDIDQACQLVANPAEAAPGAIWSVRLDKPTNGVLEDYYVQVQGIPPVLAGDREALLKPQTRRKGPMIK